MEMNIEKLAGEIARFAGLLGWNHIQREEHVPENGEPIDWFSEGDLDGLYFQFNIHSFPHCAVYDMPHGLFTGWQRVDLSRPEEEAKRLEHVFAKDNFSPENLEGFLKRYPQFSGFSWKDGGGIEKAGSDENHMSWFPALPLKRDAADG